MFHKAILRLSYLSLVVTCIACGGGGVSQVQNLRYGTPTMIHVSPTMSTVITAVSPNGKMIGLTYDPTGSDPSNTLLYWSSPTATPVVLKTPDSSLKYNASAVNDSGVIVGFTGDDPLLTKPVIWASSTANPVELSLPGDLVYGVAAGINTQGQIVGRGTQLNASSISGVFWTTSLVPTKLGQSPTHQNSMPTHISDDGTIFGINSDAFFSDKSFPAIWSADRTKSNDLPNFGSPFVYGSIFSINQHTGVSLSHGLYDASSNAPGRPAMWNGAHNVIEVKAIGLPYAISDDGVIVGYDYLSDKAVVWQSASSQSSVLNDLIPQDSGWNLVEGKFILADGSIIGAGDPTTGTGTGYFYVRRQP